VALVAAQRCDAQDVGHKLLGTLGLKAGAQPTTGVYIADRLAIYSAGELFDRRGKRVPGSVDIDALSNAIGVAATYRVPRIATYVNASIGVPISRVSAASDRVEASLDRFGLADVYVQPIALGWRLPHVDLVTGYAFYIPTQRFEPGQGSGVSRAQWAHELSAGGAVYLDRDKSWHLSALASYELHERKLGIDITRGDTVQVQGGAGKTLFKIVDVGPVAYALWQVSDDRGSALPSLLRGARDRNYGVGGELDLTLERIRSRLLVRYAHDFGARSRPQGQIVIVGVSVTAWRLQR
jgi:hypothetical protein